MLEPMYLGILVGTVLVLMAAFSSLLAARFGAPLLLLFLSIGLVAGEDGLGLHFDNAGLAYFIGSMALAIILFDSGIGTPMAAFRQSAAPALTLATLGVPITAAVFGLAAHYILHIPPLQGLLLGSIVGSTDAAAVFFLLRIGGINVRDRVRSTLEVESGSNDPMAIFLTITFVEILRGKGGLDALDWHVLVLFLRQMGLGLVAGLAGGWVIGRLLNRLRLERGLVPIFTLTLAMLLFAATGAADGSGFLATYVAGLVTGNSRIRSGPTLRQFSDGLTWLAQIIMFLVLGLLATPSQFGAIALPALGLAAVLIFVARPIAVWFCMLPFDFTSRETAFISWVGLRGSVSILLAIVPLIGGIDQNRILFNTAFIVVLASLMAQGWTIGFVARRLGLIVPRKIGPVEKFELELPGTATHELLSYRVVPGSPVARGERLPRWARPSLVIRDGQSMSYQYAGRLQANDYVYLFIASRYPRLLDRLFASPVELGPDDTDFFGDFPVDPKRPMRFLAAAYDVALDERIAARPIGDYMVERLGGRAEYGDRVPVGPIELIVRDTDESGAILAAGLALDPDASRETEITLFLNLRGWWRRLSRDRRAASEPAPMAETRPADLPSPLVAEKEVG
ncbi:K+/H+ antiporter [Aureimonas endophytica]|uniref:K+/H+ antiporter n=1 Tax=Aureimonas endophytica TaxID=2027858 RepID=A0A917E1Z3_9HYPH|nr:potassium/proton antiporter [Aureimonas endophytica]GGD94552.1 K+/H+ antiporter [Aureimonas endophytica]